MKEIKKAIEGDGKSLNNTANIENKFDLYNSFIENITTKVNNYSILDLFQKSNYLELKKSGANYHCCCPFHEENTPSFVVNQAKNMFHCFGCGESGDFISFVKKYENYNYNSEAILHIAKHYLNETIPDNPYSETQTIKAQPKKQINSSVTINNYDKSKAIELEKEIIDYNRNSLRNFELKKINSDLLFNLRGINKDFAVDCFDFKSFEYKNSDGEVKKINCENISHLSNNKDFINICCNWTPELKQRFKSLPKYLNLGQMANQYYCFGYNEKIEINFITEGVFNSKAIKEIFINNINAISLFASTNQLTDIERFRPIFENKKNIIAFDNDKISKDKNNAGYKGMINLAKFILDNYKILSLKYLEFPMGVDANDLLKENKLKDFLNNIENYKQLTPEFVQIEYNNLHDIIEKNEKTEPINQAKKSEPISTPKFPIEVFPIEIQYFINELIQKKAFPHDFICGSILSAFSTACGKKFQLKHNNYLNYAGTWIALVGESGTNKSEPLETCFEPLKNIDNELYKDYENKMIEFENYMELTPKEKKANKVYKPLFKTHVVDDITIETLYDYFVGNNHGLCSLQDELMTWVMDLERYGSKSTQTKFLSIFSNKAINYGRKNQKLRINKPFLNLVGGIQTSLLKDFANGNRDKDGTLYRFLFCFPDKLFKNKPIGEINENIYKNYKTYIEKLLFTEFGTWEESGDKTKPQLIYIDKKEASPIFEKYLDKLRDRLNSLPECYERKFIAKYDIYFYRLTLLLHLIKFAVSDGESVPNFTNSDGEFAPGFIEKDTVLNAIKLIDYFFTTAFKVGKEISNSQTEISEKEMLIHLRKKTNREYKEILEFTNSKVNENTFISWLNRSKS